MRKNWIVGLALAAPLALAACGGSAPPGTPGAGGGGGGTAGSGQTIKIASLHPLSGSSAADGQQMDNGSAPPPSPQPINGGNAVGRPPSEASRAPQVAPIFGVGLGNVVFDGPGKDEDFGLEQVTGTPADRFFNIPPASVVEIGTQTDL